MNLKRRARRAQLRMSAAYMRQIDPDIPRFLPQDGPASKIITLTRKWKKRNS
jgi:hypothetical protein